MKHLHIRWFAIMAVIFFLMMNVAIAKQATVKTTGSGETKLKAVDDAQRNAIEQELGVLLESKTYVKDFIVESDRIFTVSEGVIVSYKVLEESKDNAGLWLVTIEAIVDDDKLNGNIQMMLHKLDNPKSMVIVDPYSATLSPFARSAHRQINSLLVQKMFEVVNPDITEQLHSEVHEMMKVNTLNQAAAKLALQYNADVAWMVVVKSAKGEKLYGVQDYVAIVGCQVVAATTGRIFADEEIRVHGVDEQDAAQKAGKQIADMLIDRVRVQFATLAQAGNQYTVRLWGIGSYKDARAFRTAITTISGFSDVKQNTLAVDKGAESNFVELSVNFRGSIDELIDKVMDQLERTPGFESLDLKLQRAGQAEFVMK